MTTAPADADHLSDAVLDYLRLAEAGVVDRFAFLARYPALANELAGFLEDEDQVNPLIDSLLGPDIPEPDLTTPDRFIGDYELLAKLGGNMGAVYRAQHRTLPMEVVVKLLLRRGPRDRARFRTEAEAMSRLKHPNVIRIFAVGEANGAPYFSMELFPRGSLDRHLNRFRADPTDAARVVAGVARAIHHAHERGILHRDLKPANVLLTDEDVPVVTDFGLAMAVPQNGAAEKAEVAGTPAYMAPEQLTGDVTVATDVHGLGAVLYALVTGKAPFARPTPAETYRAVETETPDRPSKVNPRVDADLDEICKKCLEKAPADRYPSAVKLAEDLDRFLRGEVPEARPIGMFGRMWRAMNDSRHVADFLPLRRPMLIQAAFSGTTGLILFLLLWYQVSEAVAWVAWAVSRAPLFLLGRTRPTDPPGLRATRREMWTHWQFVSLAFLAVTVGGRLATTNYVTGFYHGYMVVAAIQGIIYMLISGRMLWGGHFLMGGVWLLIAGLMPVVPTWSPLLYGGMYAAVMVAGAVKLSRHGPPPAGDPVEGPTITCSAVGS